MLKCSDFHTTVIVSLRIVACHDKTCVCDMRTIKSLQRISHSDQRACLLLR